MVLTRNQERQCKKRILRHSSCRGGLYDASPTVKSVFCRERGTVRNRQSSGADGDEVLWLELGSSIVVLSVRISVGIGGNTMPQFLFYFASQNPEFRMPEIDALAHLFGTSVMYDKTTDMLDVRRT